MLLSINIFTNSDYVKHDSIFTLFLEKALIVYANDN